MDWLVVLIAFFALGAGVSALVCAFNDRRFIKSRVRSFEKTVSEAERLFDRHCRLADELAHEIKNPLAAIACSAESLQHLLGDKLPPDQRRCVQHISEYASHALRLVSDYLDVHRLSAGAIVAKREPVRIITIVQSVCGMLDALAKRNHITLTQRILDPEVSVLADPRHLKQILFNLAHNAVKYTPANGMVVIEAERAPGGRVVARVIDSGCGLSQEQCARIFLPYERLEDSTSRGREGLGLGLAICRDLVRLQGGSIDVQSEEGRGSVFEIVLEEVAVPVRARTNILVLEEGIPSTDSLAAMITACGGLVETVGQATSAIRALTEGHYDAVVLNASNYSDKGVLAQVLSQLSDCKNGARVVAAGVAPEDAHTLMALGADACLSIPLSSGEFFESLRDTK